MSYNDRRSDSPLSGREDKQDFTQQRRSDPRNTANGSVTPSSRPTRTTGQSRPLNDINGAIPSTAQSMSYKSSSQPINDAVTSAVNTTDSNVSPELIHLITQNVIQQLSVRRLSADTPTQPVQPPSSSVFDQPDSASSIQGSPVVGRTTVYTPPSPQRPEDRLSENQNAQMVPPAAPVNTRGTTNSRNRDLSPFSRGSNEDVILSDAESRSSRPDAPRRSSTDADATVLERHWGKLFDEQGQSTERLVHLLQGIALHLIEIYEPKNSLVITPDKMQRYYEATELEERQEIYPWKLIFDDKTSSISRLFRDSDVKVEHHLLQAAPDARPDIPGLTPRGFAAWMTLMLRAHPDHEFERIAKTLRIMAICHPEDRKLRFPAAISRRLIPTTGDDTVAGKLANLVYQHCKVQVSGRQNNTTEYVAREPRPQVPESPRKADAPPKPTVEDAIDESNAVDVNTGRRTREAGASISSAGSPTFRTTEASSRHGEESNPSGRRVEIDESDVPTPTPQPPLERQRQPYVAQPGGGKSHDALSSGDEKAERARMPETSNMRRTKSVSNQHRPRAPPPPIAIHQRGAPPPPQDGVELSRTRSAAPDAPEFSRSRSTITGPDAGSAHRTRSNSAYSESRPFRRPRSNSTYANDGGPRHSNSGRSPSLSKSGFDMQNPGRATVADIRSSNFTTSGGRPTSNYQPPLPAGYDYMRQSNYDSRDARESSQARYGDRERSRDRTRPRFGSTGPQDAYSSYSDDPGRAVYMNGSTMPQTAGGPYQYPPVSYRDGTR